MKDHNLHVEVEAMIGLGHTLHIVTMRNLVPLGPHTVQTTADMLAEPLIDTTTTINSNRYANNNKTHQRFDNSRSNASSNRDHYRTIIKNLMSLMFASFAINVATLRNTVTLMPHLQTLGQNFPKVTTTGLETGTIVDHETVPTTTKKTD